LARGGLLLQKGGVLMQLFHILIVIMFLLFGVYQLFVEKLPVIAVHFLLVALYFFITYHEIKGNPFARPVYLIAIFLLVTDGIINLFIFPTSLLSGIISFFFAFLAWQSMQRLQKSR
jgi:predicted membrane protein